MTTTDSHDEWQIYNLTPQYVKTTLEDLAKDQLDLEETLSKLDKRVYIFGIGIIFGIGLGVMNMKMIKMIADGLNKVGGALLVTQQAIGMVPGGSEPDQPAPKSPVQEGVPPSPATEDTDGAPDDTSVSAQGSAIEMPPVEIGATWDVGPQPGPDEPLPDSSGVREDGTGLH